MSSFASLRFLIPKVNGYLGRRLRLIRGSELDLSSGEQLVDEKNPDPKANQNAAFGILTDDLFHELIALLTLNGYEVTHLVIAQFPKPPNFHPHYLILFDFNLYGYEATFAENDLQLGNLLEERAGVTDVFSESTKLVAGLAYTPRFCAMQSAQLDYALPLPAGTDFAGDTKVLDCVRHKQSGLFHPKIVVTPDNKDEYEQPYQWLMLHSDTATKSANEIKAALDPIVRHAAGVMRDKLRFEWEQEIYRDDASERKVRVGLLSNLPPYSPWESAPVDAPKPTNWGDPFFRSDTDTDVGQAQIWKYGQEFWQQKIRLDFSDMLDWIYKFPLKKFIPTGGLAGSGLTEDDLKKFNYELGLFINAAENCYKVRHGMPPPDFIRHRILGFLDLTWFEILVLLHELNIIDWLSGINTRLIENGKFDGQPIHLAPIIEYDITGFYYRIPFGPEGVNNNLANYSTRDTLQINQAGSYLYGHWQRRNATLAKVVDQFSLYSFRIDQVAYSSAQDARVTADLKATELESGDVIEAKLAVEEDDDGTSEPVVFVALQLSDSSIIKFKRQRRDAFYSDDVLASLPEEIQTWRKIQERIPFHPDELQLLDEFVQHTLSYAYYGVTGGGVPPTEGISTHISSQMWRFAGVAGNDSTFSESSAQLPLVQYYLTSHIQGMPLPDGETLYPWEAILTTLNRHHDFHLTFPRENDFLAFLQITKEDLDDMRNPEPNFIYAYTMQGVQISASATPITGISFVDGVTIQITMKIRQTTPIPEDPSIWNETYFGTLYGAAAGPSTPVGIVYFESSSELDARTQWSPRDFLGPIAMHSGGLTITPGIGFSLNLYSYLRIWGNRPGFLADSSYVSVSGLVGGSVGLGHTSTWGVLLGFGLSEVEKTGIPGMLPYGYIEKNAWKKTDETHFYIGSPLLKEAGKKAITQMVAEFRRGFEGAGSFLEISGFASPSASKEFNMTLSHRRAQSVFNYIYQLLGAAFCIPTNSIIVRGYGETPAIIVGKLKDGVENAEWRRVDIRLNGILVGQIQGD